MVPVHFLGEVRKKVRAMLRRRGNQHPFSDCVSAIVSDVRAWSCGSAAFALLLLRGSAGQQLSLGPLGFQVALLALP